MIESQEHTQNAKQLLDHAHDMVKRGDRLQASEKIWGSVAHTLKAVAEQNSWPNKTHDDLARIASYLSAVSEDKLINMQFVLARGYHQNFYEDEYSMDQIRPGLEHAADLVRRLELAAEQVGEGKTPPNGAKSPLEYQAATAKAINQMQQEQINELRRKGLSAFEARQASIMLQTRRGVTNVSFRVGPDQRKVSVDKYGNVRVSRGKRSGGLQDSGASRGVTVEVSRRR